MACCQLSLFLKQSRAGESVRLATIILRNIFEPVTNVYTFQLWELLFPAELDNHSQTVGWRLLITKAEERNHSFLRSNMQTDDAGESVMGIGHVTTADDSLSSGDDEGPPVNIQK